MRGDQPQGRSVRDRAGVDVLTVAGTATTVTAYIPRQYVSLPSLNAGSAIESEADPEGPFVNYIEAAEWAT